MELLVNSSTIVLYYTTFSRLEADEFKWKKSNFKQNNSLTVCYGVYHSS